MAPILLPATGSSEGLSPADPGNRLVGKVLTGDGITRYGNGAYTLIGGDVLSASESLESECRV